MREVVIIDSVRTGLAKSFRGSFNQTRPDDLAAHCLTALVQRTKLDPATIDDVIVGVGIPEGPQGMNIGRVVAVRAGLPISVPGVTVSRFCASGLASIAMGAAQIAAGDADIIAAGGAESITMLQNDMNMKNLPNPWVGERKPGIYHPMGMTAEKVAEKYKVSREAQDAYALESQKRTARAQEAGYFKDEIVPMTVKYLKQDKASGTTVEVEVTVERDECNRPDTTIEGLQRLPPAFGGSVTAGNASQFSDGASMTLLMSAEKAKQLGLTPLGAFRGYAVAGCEPDEMGIGPVFSVPKLLKRKGLTNKDLDIVELNEAFASQCLYCRDTLGFDPATYNPDGGSISIGHPYGATGSRMVGHILRALRRDKKKYGLVTMCVGGGQGATGLIEAF
ncbi:MAG TPA: thiolase family protein [Polyangiaceae bacterium]|jgi:acetyl-CoA acyltransferase|nr:thiolase family protein [Polyangiaceae bacterium]